MATLLLVAAFYLKTGHLFTRHVQSISSATLVPSTGSKPLGLKVPTHPADRGADYRALRTLLAKSPGEVLAELSRIARTDPALAIDLAQALGRTDEEKANWVRAMMKQWADTDPGAAWQWLTKLSSERMSELAGRSLTDVVLNSMAVSHPEMILANADAMLHGVVNSDSVPMPVAVHLGLQALVDHGDVAMAREALEGWLKDSGHLDIETASFETVASGLMGDAPADAGEWLRSMPDSDARNAAIAGFTARWSATDPTAALQWAETLSPAEGQQAAFSRTISDWSERNPTEISQWLGNYLAQAPADAKADKLVETLINLSPVVNSDPATALQWTSLITDPQQREVYQEKTVVRWANQDPEAALLYVQQSTAIPSDRKAALIQQLQRTAPVSSSRS